MNISETHNKHSQICFDKEHLLLVHANEQLRTENAKLREALLQREGAPFSIADYRAHVARNAELRETNAELSRKLAEISQQKESLLKQVRQNDLEEGRPFGVRCVREVRGGFRTLESLLGPMFADEIKKIDASIAEVLRGSLNSIRDRILTGVRGASNEFVVELARGTFHVSPGHATAPEHVQDIILNNKPWSPCAAAPSIELTSN